MKKNSKLSNGLKRLTRLRENTSGVAMVEFAFAAPLVLALGMLGVETVNYVITHMKVSQLAMQVADNASRVGETDVLTARKVYESDINETFIGGEKLGASFNVYEQGRVIISSLQRNAENGQWIAWQRCRGAKQIDSEFGSEGTGETGTSFQGVGKPNKLLQASAGTAVIFVEVYYTYESLTPMDFLGGREIAYNAAFNIRDARDLTGLYQDNPPSPVASCDEYSADRPS